MPFLALIAVAIVVLFKSCSAAPVVDVQTGHFRNGVYIDYMDLSGKSVDEVKAQLETNASYTLNNISIMLSSEQLNATITGADMNASSDLDTVIEQALSGAANQEYHTKIIIDEAALARRIEEINASSSTPPVDATVTFDFSSSGKPTPQYIDGQAGFGLDVASTVALIKQTIESGQLQATLTPAITTVEPSVTLADVQAHTSLIGTYSTTYSFKGTAEDTEDQRAIIPNRAFNVEKAAAMINKNVVKPARPGALTRLLAIARKRTAGCSQTASTAATHSPSNTAEASVR